MKNTFLGLRTVVYKVDDLQKAKEWYAELFQVEQYFDEPFYVGFNIGGYELGLLPNEHNSPAGETVVAYWGVDNIEEKMEYCLEKGGVEHEKISDVGGGIKVAGIKDPWGNIIGIIENPLFTLK